MITVAPDWSAIGYSEIKRPPQGGLLIGDNLQPPPLPPPFNGVSLRFYTVLKSDQLGLQVHLGFPVGSSIR